METSPYYAQALEAFENNSSYMESTVTWITHNMQGILRDMLEAGTVKDGGQLRIISIGPGAGKPDAAILDEIIQFEMPVHYTAVDPNVEYMKQFKLKIAGNSKYSGVEFDFREMTAEDYLSGDASTEQFHMVFFIHSIYYFYGRVADVLEGFYNLTAKNGNVIAITAEKGRIFKKYKGKLPASDVAWSQDVDIALEYEHLTFNRTEIQYLVNTGPIFECTLDGKLLLDFLTHVPHFRETSEQDFVQEILEQLKTMSVEVDKKLVYIVTALVHTVRKM